MGRVASCVQARNSDLPRRNRNLIWSVQWIPFPCSGLWRAWLLRISRSAWIVATSRIKKTHFSRKRFAYWSGRQSRHTHQLLCRCLCLWLLLSPIALPMSFVAPSHLHLLCPWQDIQNEPLLRANPGRFVTFPIQHPEIWAMYKKAEGAWPMMSYLCSVYKIAFLYT